jgi:hypothetical protein
MRLWGRQCCSEMGGGGWGLGAGGLGLEAGGLGLEAWGWIAFFLHPVFSILSHVS